MTLEKIVHSIDGYKDTVWMILAFIHELTWDDARRQVLPADEIVHEHGVKQKRKDPKAPPVTPDVALIVAKTGVIGDVKVGFATEAKGRDSIRDQLLGYDEVLDNWCAGRTTGGSLVLLTHHTRKVDAADYFRAEVAAKRFAPKHKFAIVSGVRTSQGKERMTLERGFGELALGGKDAKLRKTVPIDIEHLTRRFLGVRFYDAEPPPAYLLLTIWDNVLPVLVSEESFQDDARGGRTEVTASVDDVAGRLRDFFSLKAIDKRLPGSPGRASVERALDELVRFKLGEKVGGKYVFKWRKLRGGTLAYLAKKLHPPAKRSRAAPREQLSLNFDAKGPRTITRATPKAKVAPVK